MDQKEIAAAAEKAAKEATDAERARVGKINELFAKKDPAFALDQIAKGATVDGAKIAWADVVEAKNAKLEKDLADAKKPGARKAGADVLEDDGTGGEASGEHAFMARARAVQAERKCTRREALSYVARTEKALYQAYIEDCESKAKKIKSGGFERVGSGR